MAKISIFILLLELVHYTSISFFALQMESITHSLLPAKEVGHLEEPAAGAAAAKAFFASFLPPLMNPLTPPYIQSMIWEEALNILAEGALTNKDLADCLERPAAYGAHISSAPTHYVGKAIFESMFHNTIQNGSQFT